MNSAGAFIPSMALSSATRQALQALTAHWPKLLHLSFDHSEDAQRFVDDYAFAMRDVDPRAIPMAVRAWISEEQYAPRPAELARVARELSRQKFPSAPVSIVPPPLDHVKADDRVETLGRRAYRVLSSWKAVEAVWAWLFRDARDPDDLQKIRCGDVSTERFDQAIRGVRAQQELSIQPNP